MLGPSELALWRGEEARNGHYIAVRVGGVRCVIWFGYGVRGADAYIDVLCLGSHCGTRENRCAQSRKNVLLKSYSLGPKHSIERSIDKPKP